MFIRYNANPLNLNVGDCVIRALAKALSFNWFMVHDELSFLARKMYDMPSSNRVWKTYLKEMGYKETYVDNTCPDCFTVKKFCALHPKGRYVLSTCECSVANSIVVTGNHVVAVIDGDYYDTWDSGSDIPLSFFYVGN